MAIPSWRDPDWQCIHFIADKELADALDQFGSQDKIIKATIEDSEKIALLKTIAQAFRFPGDFGENWDALDDMLRDLSWLPGECYVFFIENASKLLCEHAINAGMLIDAWLMAAEWWSKRGVGFHLVFVVDT